MKQKVHKTQITCILGSVIFYEYSYKTFFKCSFKVVRSVLKIDISAVRHLFCKLDTDEVLRIELINGTKLYCLPCDDVYIDNYTGAVGISKQIKKDKRQQIRIIDVNAIAVVCTMSRKTYDLKLQRGELYV